MTYKTTQIIIQLVDVSIQIQFSKGEELGKLKERKKQLEKELVETVLPSDD